jgi:hypothetical protein
MSAVMLKLPEVHRLTRLRRPRKGLATPARSSMAHKQLAKKPAIGDGLSLKEETQPQGSRPFAGYINSPKHPVSVHTHLGREG